MPGLARIALRPAHKACLAAFVSTAPLGCQGPQSALDPAGADAAILADLFWWMTGGVAVVWTAMMALTLYAAFSRGTYEPRTLRRTIIVGGSVIPTLVISALLFVGLRPLPRLLDAGPEDGVSIHVSGEQWWWRVEYHLPSGEDFTLANEIRLPAGSRTRLVLSSPDVIHSFWVPALAGKMDMIPGRTTYLGLEPTRPGTYHGVCAEYCGSAHTQMQFRVVVMEPAAFSRWMTEQARPAPAPVSTAARRGAKLFRELGCGACHLVRGTHAVGVLGPDLTHVGSRRSLGAGILANELDDFERWLEATSDLKPGVHMPTFSMLSARELEDLAHYLESLQ